MNQQETVLLIRMVKAVKPAQAIDYELGGDIWAEILADIRLEDAKTAVVAISKRTSNFIDPSMIRAEVQTLRNDRRRHHDPITPPPGLTPTEFLEWSTAVNRAIGDGRILPDRWDHRTNQVVRDLPLNRHSFMITSVPGRVVSDA